MSAIDSYVRELDRHLHGPRRRKADMLGEVRDGLLDAAEAVREESPGVSAREAERRAVDEFGPVRRLAPEFQAELAVTHATRTALTFAIAMPLILAITTVMWRSGSGAATSSPVRVASTGYHALALATDALLVFGGIGFGLAILALQWHARRASTPLALARAVGGAAVGAVVAMVSAGVVLTMDAPSGGTSFLGALWSGLPTAPGYALLFYLGARCLRLSRTSSGDDGYGHQLSNVS